MQLDIYNDKIPLILLEKAKKIKLLICDVDGVLSNGLIYLGNNNEEFKTFHVHDGYGIKALLSSSIHVALITGRNSKIVDDRANSLGIKYVYQGITEKLPIYQKLINKLNIQPNEVAYVGDDLVDLPIMQQIGFSVSVQNAHPLLKKQSDFITKLEGGKGAVREVCDLILISQSQLETSKGLSI